MTNTTQKYLVGASLVFQTYFLNVPIVCAELCTPVPTCDELGYTETDCGKSSAIKCPFNKNKMFCNSLTCEIGDIYYNDDTCSANVISGKIPIGVIYDDVNRLVISLEGLSPQKWSESRYDILELPNYKKYANKDVYGKKNTDIIAAYAQYSGEEYKPAQYCYSMTTGGKTWYLPAGGELFPLLAVRSTVSRALESVRSELNCSIYWTSTENDPLSAWYLDMNYGSLSNGLIKTRMDGCVRCIFKY